MNINATRKKKVTRVLCDNCWYGKIFEGSVA